MFSGHCILPDVVIGPAVAKRQPYGARGLCLFVATCARKEMKFLFSGGVCQLVVLRRPQVESVP